MKKAARKEGSDSVLHSISAIIPAAGRSSRMGDFKPLLPLGDTTVLRQQIRLLESAGITDIKVVTGYRAADIAVEDKASNVRYIVNNDWPDGMLSSIRAGIRTLDSSCKGFFILPVDIPLIRRQTLHTILEAAAEDERGIFYPNFQGKRGHPPLVPADLVASLLAWNGQGGLRGFLSRYEHRAKDIAVADEGILLDMDTPEDYEDIKHRYRRLAIRTKRQCEAILSDTSTLPEGLVEH